MDDDTKAFLEWAEAAPDVAAEREMGEVERFLIGEIEGFFRATMRWQLNHVKSTAAVLRRMEQVPTGQVEPVTLHCENCGEWMTMFEIARGETVCYECKEDDEGQKLLWAFPGTDRPPTA